MFILRRNNLSGNAGGAKIAGWQNVFTLFMLLLAGLMIMPYFSCEVSVEEPVVVTTFPLESGGIIYGDWTPVKIGFSDTMVEADVAYLAEVVSVWDHNHIAVPGNITWEDNAVYFSPLEKWKTGEKYVCRINGVFSVQDGRVVSIKSELVFFAIADTEAELPEMPAPPEVAEVLLLKKTESGNYADFAYDADEYWNNAAAGECGLRILFDREMDLSEPKKSLRMELYRNYTVKVIDNKTLDVYFEPEAKPVKKVSFTVKADLHSAAGEEMERDYTFDFTEWKSDFEVTEIIVLESVEFYENDDGALDLSKLNKPYRVGAEWYEYWMTDFTFHFNRPVNLAAALSILSKIELVPDDARIKEAPSLVSIEMFASDYDQTWGDMEFGDLEDPYRYLLKIPGGIDGINDGNGHYLKEDMTVTLHVVDWDEIDPYYNNG
jgi:hypothetical protein